MESRAKLLGHPIHPMLIVLPLGLLISAVVFDSLYLWRGSATFAAVAYWNIAGAIIGGLLAAVFGFIDWMAIPGGTRAKRIGLLHGGSNVVVVGAFALAWFPCEGTRQIRRRAQRSLSSRWPLWRWEASPAGLAASWWTALAWA